MASASSWKGKMFSSSPLRTEGHIWIVLWALEPLVRASRTILRRRAAARNRFCVCA